MTPRVGDQVLYHLPDFDPEVCRWSNRPTLEASVTRVHSDRYVDLEVTDADGKKHPRGSILLVHSGAHRPASNFAVYPG